MESTARSEDEKRKAKEAAKTAKGKGSGSDTCAPPFVYFEDVMEKVKLGEGAEANWEWVLKPGR